MGVPTMARVLREAGQDLGFEVVDVSSVLAGDERISSTLIREALARADFERAEEMLGRPYSIEGKVVYGSQLGRTIGVPTANVELHRYRAPLSGVYVVEGEGAAHAPVFGVANVGFRPTIGDLIKAILEVHLLDFNDDIYGKTIRVRFLHKLREEQKFDSIDILTSSIKADIRNAIATRQQRFLLRCGVNLWWL